MFFIVLYTETKSQGLFYMSLNWVICVIDVIHLYDDYNVVV